MRETLSARGIGTRIVETGVGAPDRPDERCETFGEVLSRRHAGIGGQVVVAGLTAAAVVAVGAGAGLIVLRLLRKEPIQPATSILVRRPLVGVMWNLMRRGVPDPSWRIDRTVLRGFDVATVVFAAVFGARFVVQQWLYDGGFTGWLALARIAMGYPLLGLALAVVYWAVRRANRRAGDSRPGDEANERMVEVRG